MVATLEIGQALYGYSDGHRQVAASRSIDSESNRLLRTVTDMGFDGKADRYLTVVPLPKLQCQAFIRTWPAGQALRPGSVWSHVVLVQFDVLDASPSLEFVAGQFRRPRSDEEPNLELLRSAYSHPLRPVVPDTVADDRQLDAVLAERLVSSVYGGDVTAQVVVSDTTAAEPILLALMGQQWPRLRHTFSCRTRYRASSSGNRFDLEVVERLGRQRTPSAGAVDHWATIVVDELLHPVPEVRRRIQRFGNESSRGRSDLPALVRILSEVGEATPPLTVVEELGESFPDASEMVSLKRSLLGVGESTTEISGPSWPAGDPDRLELLLQGNPSAFDYESLAVPRRLGLALSDRPQGASSALLYVRWNDLDEGQMSSLVVSAIDHAAESEIVASARRSDVFRLASVRMRPGLLGTAALWEGLREEDLTGILDATDDATRREVFLRLVDSGSPGPAATVCAMNPPLWWLPVTSASDATPLSVLLGLAATLFGVHERVGDVGSPEMRIGNKAGLVVLAMAASPLAELWRNAADEAWVGLAEALPDRDQGVDDAAWSRLRTRLCSVALLAAVDSRDSQLQRRAWLAAFETLHAALAGDQTDSDDWAALSRILRDGSDWDRCGRLRNGVARAAEDSAWTSADIDRIGSQAGSFGSDLVSRINRAREPKPKSWFESIFGDWL